MRRRVVIGNWKMHGSLESTAALLADLDLSSLDPEVEVAVCPTSLHIAVVERQLSTDARLSRVKVGAQNVSDAVSGAFTGEIAAGMLTDFGVSFALVGHSERRELFGGKRRVGRSQGRCGDLCRNNAGCVRRRDTRGTTSGRNRISRATAAQCGSATNRHRRRRAVHRRLRANLGNWYWRDSFARSSSRGTRSTSCAVAAARRQPRREDANPLRR